MPHTRLPEGPLRRRRDPVGRGRVAKAKQNASTSLRNILQGKRRRFSFLLVNQARCLASGSDILALLHVLGRITIQRFDLDSILTSFFDGVQDSFPRRRLIH